MTDKTYPIRGIQVPAGSPIPDRRNVNVLQKAGTDPNNVSGMMQWSLFITAMGDFQAIPIEKKLSYFQIAGIHGFPRLYWDEEGKPGEKGFYCHHNDMLFATWHRPYMLLVEQRLYELMVESIDKFPFKPGKKTKEDWRAAADTWRLPYWDWTEATLPDICTTPVVDIMDKDEIMRTVPNPFWKFTNPKLGKDKTPLPMGSDEMGIYKIKDVHIDHTDITYPWSECKATSRHGILLDSPSTDWVDGKQDTAACNSAFQHPGDNPNWPANETIKQAVERMLSKGYCPTYESFASTIYHPIPDGSKETAFMSLEYIHNNIHGWTGGFQMKKAGGSSDTAGAGHMCSIPVAAFDPIFYLHHCFIDKLLAQWQALNWEKWFDTPEHRDEPKPKADLRPFHKDEARTPYTSNDVRRWTDLGYGYEKIKPPPKPSQETEARFEEKKEEDEVEWLSELIEHTNLKYGYTRKMVLEAPDEIRGKHNDYIINVIYDRYALGGTSYTIHFFLGEVDDVSGLSTNPNHVGIVYTFSGGIEFTAECDNCSKQSKAGHLSTAQVPLTAALLRYAKDEDRDLWSLKPDKVSDYLKKHLHWKFVAMPGTIIPLESVPNTKIGVFRGRVDYSRDSTVPSHYHDYEPVYECTANKPGGVPEGEDMTAGY